MGIIDKIKRLFSSSKKSEVESNRLNIKTDAQQINPQVEDRFELNVDAEKNSRDIQSNEDNPFQKASQSFTDYLSELHQKFNVGDEAEDENQEKDEILVKQDSVKLNQNGEETDKTIALESGQSNTPVSDNKKIEQLVDARVEYQKKIEKIDAEILAVQRSTRTLISFMSPLHNYFRMSLKWYYKWHLWRYADLIHWIVLTLFILITMLSFFFPILQNPKIAKAATLKIWSGQSWEEWSFNNLHYNSATGSVVFNEANTDEASGTEKKVGSAVIAFAPENNEVVDWLAAKSEIEGNGEDVLIQYSTDNILWGDKIEEVPNSDLIHVKISSESDNGNLQLKSFSLNYSRLPLSPDGIHVIPEKKKQLIKMGSFVDPDGDNHQATEVVVSKKSGDYSLTVFSAVKNDGDLNSVEINPILESDYYFLKARYQDSVGAWSLWSKEYAFQITKEKDEKTNKVTTEIKNDGTKPLLQDENEIINKRTETTKTLDAGGKKRTLESYSGIIHYKENYQDKNTEWKDINPDHSVDYPEYVLFDQMPSTVKVFKDKIGYEIESRKTGDKFTIELQDVDGNPKVSRSLGSDGKVAWADINPSQKLKVKSQKSKLADFIFPSALAEKTEEDDSNLKFEFEIGEYGVRLWKTIKGDDAPKNFKWKITKENGQIEPGKDDLKFRDKPEAFEVLNGEDQRKKRVEIDAKVIEQPDPNAFIWQETAPKSDLKIDTDVVFYPDEYDNSNPASADGEVFADGADTTWSNIIAHEGNSVYDDGASGTIAGYDWLGGGAYEEWNYLSRSIFTFDTSTIGQDSSIDSATLSLHGYEYGKYDGCNDGTPYPLSANVYNVSPASNNDLVAGDFDSFETTALATSDIDYASYSETAYNDFFFNQDGKDSIAKTDVSKFGIRDSYHDAGGNEPGNKQEDVTCSSFFGGYYSEETGTDYDPKLSITYAAGAVTWDGGGTTNNWSDGDNWSGDSVPNEDVVFNSTSTKDSSIDSSFAGSIRNLTIDTGYTGTITLETDFSVTGDLTINEGTLDLNGHNLSVTGTFTNYGALVLQGGESVPTVNYDGGVVVYTGTSGYTDLVAGSEYYDLVIEGGCEWGLTSDVTINNRFTLNDGSITTANSSQVYVKGDYEIGTNADGGTATINLNENITQEIDSCASSSSDGYSPPISVNKSLSESVVLNTYNCGSGYLNLYDTNSYTYQNLSLVNGTFLSGDVYSIYLDNFTITDGFVDFINLYASSVTGIGGQVNSIQFDQDADFDPGSTTWGEGGYAVEIGGGGSAEVTLSNNLTVNGEFWLTDGAINGNYTVYVKGDYYVDGNANGGTAIVVLDGAGDQNIYASGGYSPKLEISKDTGLVYPQNGLVISIDGGTTLADFILTKGTIDLGSAQIDIDCDDLIQTSGTIQNGILETSPSSSFTGVAGSWVNAELYVVIENGTTINPGAVTYDDFRFSSATGSFHLTDNMQVENFTIEGNSLTAEAGKKLSVHGNFRMDYGIGGSGVVVLNGDADQTTTDNSGGYGYFPNIEINKGSGKVFLPSTTQISTDGGTNMGNLTLISGNIDLNGGEPAISLGEFIMSGGTVENSAIGEGMLHLEPTAGLTFSGGTWGDNTTLGVCSPGNDYTWDTGGITYKNVSFLYPNTVAISGNLDINGYFHANQGTTVDLDTYDPTVNIAGNIEIGNESTITKSSAGSLVTFDGDLTYTDNSDTSDFGNIQIGASPDTTDLATDMTCSSLTIPAGDVLNTNGYEIDCSGDITINGTLDATDDVETDGSFINLGGDWTFAATGATFTHDSSSTVEFDGSGTSQIFGETTFYNFGCSTGGKTLEFEQGKTQTVDGTWTILGNDLTTEAITLTDWTDNTTTWKVNPMAWSVDNVIVNDSENLASTPINPSNWTDNGDNVNWESWYSCAWGVGQDGSELNPYEISTVGCLQAMRDDLDAYYILSDDIDASATSTWNNSDGFTPIGSYSSPFSGSLDGNNKMIDELFINMPTQDNVGLFGYVNNAVDIKDLTLTDVDITGGGKVGALSGEVNGTSSVENCHVRGGSVAGGSAAFGSGGLIGGYSGTSNLLNSSADVAVSGFGYVGGLVGVASHGISSSYALGSVTATGDSAGGLLGFLGPSTSAAIEDCYAQGSVTAANNAGGLIGTIDNSSNLYSYSISDSYSVGSITATLGKGGFLGLIDSNDGTVTLTDNYWDTDTSGTTNGVNGGNVSEVTGKTTTLMKQAATYTDNPPNNPVWDYAATWAIDEDLSYPYFQWQCWIWDGGASSDVWTDPLNWNRDSGYPDDASDKVLIMTDFSGTGISTPGSASLTLGGITFTAAAEGTLSLANNLALDNTGGYGGTLAISSSNAKVKVDSNGLAFPATGTFSNSGTLELNGDETLTLFLNDTDSGTVDFIGSGTYADLSGFGDEYWDLHINYNAGDGEFTLPASLAIYNDFYQKGGTVTSSDMTIDGDMDLDSDSFTAGGSIGVGGNLSVGSAGAYVYFESYAVTIAGNVDIYGTLISTTSTLTVSGDFTNYGSFDNNGGTVILDGFGSDIDIGSSAFYDLEIDSGGKETLTALTDIDNDLTLTGGVLDLGTGTNVYIGQDFYANSGGTFIESTSNVIFNGGSQTLYSGGDGEDYDFYNLQKDGTDTLTIDTNAVTVDGILSISSGCTIDANGQNLYIDGLDNEGTLKFKGSESSSTISTADIDSGLIEFYDSGTYTLPVGITSFYNLKFTAGTFSAGAGFTVYGQMEIVSTFKASNKTISLSGDIEEPIKAGGSFEGETSTIVYDGAFSSGSVKIYVPSDTTKSYYNLTIDNSSETYIPAGDFNVRDTLTVTAGILDGQTNTITLNGDGIPFVATAAENFAANAGKIVYAQAAAATEITAATYYDLDLGTVSPGSSATFSAGGSFEVENILQILDEATFDAESYTIVLSGDDDPFFKSLTGTFDADASTFTYSGATANILATTYFNLSCDADTTGSYTPDGDVTVGGQLSIASGSTLNGGTGTEITLSGSGTGASAPFIIISGGAFEPDSSKVIYTGTSTTDIKGAIDYYDLAVNSANSSNVFSPNNNITVENVLSVDSGELDLGNTELTLSGSGTPLTVGNDGILDTDTSLIIFDGLETTATSIPGITYYDITFSGTDTWTLLDSIVAHTVVIEGGILTTSASNYDISIFGNWTNIIGTTGFVAGTGEVILAGADSSTQEISGSTNFNDLTISTASNSVGRTVQFNSGDTFGVDGTWSVTGYSGKVITMQASSTTNWTIDPDAANVTYADVSHSTSTLAIWRCRSTPKILNF